MSVIKDKEIKRLIWSRREIALSENTTEQNLAVSLTGDYGPDHEKSYQTSTATGIYQ